MIMGYRYNKLLKSKVSKDHTISHHLHSPPSPPLLYLLRNVDVKKPKRLNRLIDIKVDIPGGLTRQFRALWSIELCKQLRKSQLLINKLIWSECYGINCFAIPERGDQWLRNFQ